MSTEENKAVVIGGSMAGLLAARVLADRFERVILIERDRFPEGPGFREGVPQSRHLHMLLARGQRIIENLFPGLEEELVSSGAELMDMGEGGSWLTPAGLAPRFHSGIPLVTCSRGLIETSVRERVAALPNVRLLERTDATGLLPTPGESVAGVRIQPRDGRNGRGSTLYADLVVDAGGRDSNAPRWLERLGYERPQETRINARPGYATRLFEPPENAPEGRRLIFIQAAPPEHGRGGIMFPVEGGLWMCSLIGMGGDHPPTDEEGYMEFARSLRDPMLYEAIKDAPPASPIHGYREVSNKRRHYEKLRSMPRNFLVTGDAACSFNPVYGQGMTTAALGAETLAECLRNTRGGGFDGLSRRFQRKLAKAGAAPWLLATGEDFRVREVEGGRASPSTRLVHRYMDAVLDISMRDLGVRRTFLEVFGMLRSPTALFSPAIAAKVFGTAIRRQKTGGTAAPGQPVPEVA